MAVDDAEREAIIAVVGERMPDVPMSTIRSIVQVALADRLQVLKVYGARQVTAEGSSLCDRNGYVVSGPAYVFEKGK